MSKQQWHRCDRCESLLTSPHHVFGFQWNQLSYELEGDTPSDQAILHPLALNAVARFCGADCCQSDLPSLLAAQGLPAHLMDHCVQGGPIEPCAKCSKPVNLTQPHGAWIKGQVSVPDGGDIDQAPDWLDVMAVVCQSCVAPQLMHAVQQAEHSPLTPFQELLRELDALDAEEDALHRRHRVMDP